MTPSTGSRSQTSSDLVGKIRRRQSVGWVACFAAALLLLSAYSAGLFFYAILVLIMLWTMGAGLASVSLLRLEVGRELGATQIEVGESVDTKLEIRNAKALPAFWIRWEERIQDSLDVEDPLCGFKTFGPHHVESLSYRVYGTRRGLFQIGPALIEASDPFGLIRRFLVDGETKFVTVLPRRVPIGQGWPLGHRPVHEVATSRSGLEDPCRFLGVRPYQPSDGTRHVHWRATARTGAPQVKRFEPCVLEGVILAVDMGFGADLRAAVSNRSRKSSDSVPEQELAVTAAASVAEFVLLGGQEVGLISNGGDAAELHGRHWKGATFRRVHQALSASGGSVRSSGYRPLEVPPGRGLCQRDKILTALARLVPARGPSLAELLSAELPRFPRSHVLVIVTTNLASDLSELTTRARHSGIDVSIVCVPEPKSGNACPTDLWAANTTYIVRDEPDLQYVGAQQL